MSRRAARWPMVGALEQSQTLRRIIAYGRDLRLGPGKCSRLVAHRQEVLVMRRRRHDPFQASSHMKVRAVAALDARDAVG